MRNNLPPSVLDSEIISTREPHDIARCLEAIAHAINRENGAKAKRGTVLSHLVHTGLPALCHKHQVPLPVSLKLKNLK